MVNLVANKSMMWVERMSGDKGLTGDAGADSVVVGPQGIQGIQGVQGDAGADSVIVGPQGIQGIQGDAGPQGIQGDAGADSTVAGPKGDTGDTGADSVIAGPQGIQGIQGIQGDAGADAPSSGFPAGTKMLFNQTAAPTGWTKDTTHDNKALRVVSGTVGDGGSVDFTSAFASKSVAGTVGNTSLSKAQLASHTHTYNQPTGSSSSGSKGYKSHATSTNSGSTGSGSSHTHSFTGTAIDLAVKYVDLIIATKD